MFKPGDVLLYESQPGLKFGTVIPKLIQLCTGNKIMHTALYLGCTSEGHVILDALADGVLLKTFSESELYLRPEELVLSAVARLEANIPLLDVMSKASKYSLKPYGFVTITNLLLQHGKTRLFPKKSWTTWFKSKNGYICSEVCQLVLEELLRENKQPIPFPKLANLTEPDDYLSAPWKVISV